MRRRFPVRSAVAAIREVAGGRTARAAFAGLANQGIVSGTSFATTVLVGRVGGDAELGAYSLAISLILLALAVQDSLVTVPHTVFVHRLPPEERGGLRGSALLLHAGIAGGATALCLAAALAIRAGAGAEQYAPIALALAAAIPLWLLRELGRQLSFAALAMKSALVLDATVAAIQLAGLGILARTGALTAPRALAVIALACGVGGLGWLARTRRTMVVRRDDLPRHVRSHWSFGRWVAADQVAGLVQGYGVHWMLALVLGLQATGRFAAALTVVLMTNPLILGLVNVLAPRAARAWAEEGRGELRRVVVKATGLLALVLVPLWAVLAFYGGPIVAWIYGPAYADLDATVALLATAALAWSVDVPVGSGLRAMGRPDVNLYSSVGALASTLPLAWLLGGAMGPVGGAAALLAGAVVRAVWRWALFLRLTPG